MNHEYEGYNIRVIEAAGLAAIIFPPGETAIMAGDTPRATRQEGLGVLLIRARKAIDKDIKRRGG